MTCPNDIRCRDFREAFVILAKQAAIGMRTADAMLIAMGIVTQEDLDRIHANMGDICRERMDKE